MIKVIADVMWIIFGILLLTLFLYKFNPNFSIWLKSFPMSDGSESGKLMPGMLIWFFIYFIIGDLILFAVWIFNK